MFDLDHAVAAGPDLRAAALHISRRIGFTIARGENEHHYRIIFSDGYLDMREQAQPAHWSWSRFYLRHPDLSVAQAGLKQLGLLPGTQRTVVEPSAVEHDIKGTLAHQLLPHLIEYTGPMRPQEEMEPERAKAVVVHPNTAQSISGVMLLVPEVEPVVQFYERLLGRPAGEPFSNDVLGVAGRAITLVSGKQISIVSAPFGTGPAARFQAESGPGIFALVVRVQSVEKAGECLHNGSVYCYYSGGRLITTGAFPGYGALIFEQAVPPEGAAYW